MFALIKPLVLTGLKSDKFKKFVVELLEKLVESTDNELDDRALQRAEREAAEKAKAAKKKKAAAKKTTKTTES